MTHRIIIGDALESLRGLPDQSVHCCVTSPPYFGLRDYGTARWSGGSNDCDHMDAAFAGSRTSNSPKQQTSKGSYDRQFVGRCRKCGATREDGQIGLENSPEAFVANLVAVFREVRRVLRDDGTLWLNLGSSYASGGTPAIRFPRPGRDHSCGNDGKALLSSQGAGRACLGSDDGLQGATLIHRADTARSGQFAEPDAQQTLPTVRDAWPADCAPSPPAVLPHAAPASTTPKSSGQHRADAGQEATASDAPPFPQTSSPDVPESADMPACTSGTSLMSPPLVVRMRDKESFYSACRSPDCRGVGRCGLCWCNLAIPSLTFKAKDLISIPQLVAFALQADGWHLRQDIIWSKGNPMPEPVKDRCTRAHEYIFMLSKKPKYFYDHKAIMEPVSEVSLKRAEYGWNCDRPSTKNNALGDKGGIHVEKMGARFANPAGRNKRSVWRVNTSPYRGAHFATYPPKLIEPCILAGCPEGGTVLDPFAGSGTTGMVAKLHRRGSILIDLNPANEALMRERLDIQPNIL